MILIVGASGYIGKSLYTRFAQNGFSVLGTYNKNPQPGLVPLDLAQPDFSILTQEEPLEYVLIASGANATLDAARQRQEGSHNVNVVGVKRLIDACFERNITPVYISTDAVFSGEGSYHRENDKRQPINYYGEIKVEIEDYLFAIDKPSVILRMSRVFGTEKNDGTLLMQLKSDMAAGNDLTIATDQVFTPIHVDDLYYFTKEILARGVTGVYHLASTRKMSRYEIAEQVRQFFGYTSEITPCSIDLFDFLEKRPKDTSLNIEKIKRLTGFKERELEDFLLRMRE